jgi:hypothetical protein
MAIVRVGDWAAAQAFLTSGPTRVDAALKVAVRREAELFRKEVVQGIAKQAPGDKPFKPLSKRTLALRRFQGFKGKKALIRRGDLRKAVKVTIAPGGFFVGILRSARSSTGDNLVNVAAVHEFGATIVLRMTPKMRRYLLMVFAKAGLVAPAAPSTSGPSSRVIIVRIPPRPFFGPVADKIRPGSAARVVATVQASLGIK